MYWSCYILWQMLKFVIQMHCVIGSYIIIMCVGINVKSTNILLSTHTYFFPSFLWFWHYVCSDTIVNACAPDASMYTRLIGRCLNRSGNLCWCKICIIPIWDIQLMWKANRPLSLLQALRKHISPYTKRKKIERSIKRAFQNLWYTNSQCFNKMYYIAHSAFNTKHVAGTYF